MFVRAFNYLCWLVRPYELYHDANTDLEPAPGARLETGLLCYFARYLLRDHAVVRSEPQRLGRSCCQHYVCRAAEHISAYCAGSSATAQLTPSCAQSDFAIFILAPLPRGVPGCGSELPFVLGDRQFWAGSGGPYMTEDPLAGTLLDPSPIPCYP